jgi:hypothetical protein
MRAKRKTDSPEISQGSCLLLTGLALILAFLNTEPAAAKYIPPPFYQLALADLVLVGEITDLRYRTFILRIDEVLGGTYNRSQIEIPKFKDWTCAIRWKPYRVGQHEIVFLRSETGGSYSLISAGDEGEWEIQGDTVISLGFRIPGIAESGISEHPGQTLQLADVRNAIREFRGCFAIKEGDEEKWNPRLNQHCTADFLEEIAKRSIVHRYLIDTGLQATISVARNAKH